VTIKKKGSLLYFKIFRAYLVRAKGMELETSGFKFHSLLFGEV